MARMGHNKTTTCRIDALAILMGTGGFFQGFLQASGQGLTQRRDDISNSAGHRAVRAHREVLPRWLHSSGLQALLRALEGTTSRQHRQEGMGGWDRGIREDLFLVNLQSIWAFEQFDVLEQLMLETTKDNIIFLYISILLREWNQIEAAFEVCKCDLTDIFPFLSTFCRTLPWVLQSWRSRWPTQCLLVCWSLAVFMQLLVSPAQFDASGGTRRWWPRFVTKAGVGYGVDEMQKAAPHFPPGKVCESVGQSEHNFSIL